jgi:hypothetical protein
MRQQTPGAQVAIPPCPQKLRNYINKYTCQRLLVNLHRVDQPVCVLEGRRIIGNVVIARGSKTGTRAAGPHTLLPGPGTTKRCVENYVIVFEGRGKIAARPREGCQRSTPI